jgi:hypothetical protein
MKNKYNTTCEKFNRKVVETSKIDSPNI